MRDRQLAITKTMQMPYYFFDLGNWYGSLSKQQISKGEDREAAEVTF